MLRDRNHPSVVMWSLGNEITDRTNGQRGAELAALLAVLDPTRPSTLCGGSTPSADDPSWGYVDVNDVYTPGDSVTVLLDGTEVATGVPGGRWPRSGCPTAPAS